MNAHAQNNAPDAPDFPDKPDPYSSLRHGPFRRFFVGNFLFNLGRQGLVVALAWQVYIWTNSYAALGFIGAINVLPLIAFFLPAGVLADRVDRRKIIGVTMSISFALSAMLALSTHFHDSIPYFGFLRGANNAIHAAANFFTAESLRPGIRFDNPALPIVFLLQLCQAVALVAGNPARGAIIPQLVPGEKVSNAFMWNSSGFELATVIGPVLGGIASSWSATPVYALDAVFSLALALSLLGVRLTEPARKPAAAGGGASDAASENAPVAAPPGVFAGISFIWRHKPILACITLDLFAVLLGGLTALFPVYAKEVLLLGPAGYGYLRAAPSLGAITMAFIVAHSRPFKRPGVSLLWTVAGFGAAIVLFALSRNIVLSLVALFLSGMCDNVSVVVRHTCVQMLTPGLLRGRVTAVNQLFIGSSNQISEFRGGMMAAQFGPVFAATFGGICTMFVVVAVALALPSIRTVPPLNELKPLEE